MVGLADIALASSDAAGRAGAWPMSYLKTFEPRADPATTLLWGLAILSLAVVAIITVLVVAGVLARRRRGAVASLAALPAVRGSGGLMWFYVGMPLTVIALVGAMAWTVGVLAAIDSPPVKPRLTVEITGRQWWWEARYLFADAREDFVTANEIHVPTGAPVLIKLVSADVIHSFWAPGLTGKTDAIPGQVNVAWLQADQAGVYRGQCAEFCGVQHAHMALEVVAEAPAAFAAWSENQARPAAPAASAAGAGGEKLVQTHCGGCHAIRGTGAHGVVADAGGPASLASLAAEAAAHPPDGEHGVVAPDLTHLMSRTSLAAGAAPNTVGGLSGWIANPQALKPGTRMPVTYLSGPQLSRVVAYLETLR